MFLLLAIWLLASARVSALTSAAPKAPETIQQFLALPSIGPLAPFTKSITGFANQHVTAVSLELSNIPTPTGTYTSTEYYGSLLVGFNDHEYTHVLSLSASEETVWPTTYAFCTGTSTTNAIWTCNSSVVYVESPLSAVPSAISTVTKTFPATTFTTADHLYEIGIEGLLRPPT